MAKIDFDKIPKFSQLPVKSGAPADSNWGVFGDNDEVGCVNFLTEEGVIQAARLVQNGKVFRLDTPINYASPPLFRRRILFSSQAQFCWSAPVGWVPTWPLRRTRSERWHRSINSSPVVSTTAARWLRGCGTIASRQSAPTARQWSRGHGISATP